MPCESMLLFLRLHAILGDQSIVASIAAQCLEVLSEFLSWSYLSNKIDTEVGIIFAHLWQFSKRTAQKKFGKGIFVKNMKYVGANFSLK